jgi:peptidoglycan hydrolase CwlO-like protein
MSTNNTKELKTQITSLRLRINELVEEMYSLKNEVKRFKEDVANDVKYLTERVDS